MEHAIPFRFLKIGDYFHSSVYVDYIKVSETEACNKLGIKYFAKNKIIYSDPNHKIKGG